MNLLTHLLQAGSPSPELSTPSSSETQTTIRLLYGHSIAKELLNTKIFSSSKSKGKGKEPAQNDDMDLDENGQGQEELNQPDSWSAEAYFTNANYQAKKFVFLLFINRRRHFVYILLGI